MFNGSKMKSFVIILAIVMVSSFAVAGIIFVAEYGNKGFTMTSDIVRPTNAVNVDEEKSEPVPAIKDIKIKTTSEDIKFITTDSNEVKAHFYGYYSTSNQEYKPELVMNSENGVLTIEIKHKSVVMVSYTADLKLDIYLPKTYANNLQISVSSSNVNIDELNLESFVYKATSGDIQAGTLNAKKAEIKATSGTAKISGKYDSFVFISTSGDFTSEGITAKDATLRSNSGRIEINATIDSLQMTSTSGDLKADNLNAKSTRFTTSSGSIKASGIPGNLEATSTSGDITVDYSKFNNDINIKTSSGRTELSLPEDSGFILKYSSSSGYAKCDFPITISGPQGDNKINGTVGNGKNKVTVNSTSGDLSIKT
jgi:hypothetical protein